MSENKEVFVLSLLGAAYFFGLLLIGRGENIRLQYGYVFMPYIFIFAILLINYSKRNTAMLILIMLLVLLTNTSYKLYQAHMGKIPSEKVVHHWHNQAFYPGNVLNDKAIIITGKASGEHLRPCVYHSQFKKTAFIINDFCPEIFSNLNQTTVMIDKLNPSLNTDEIVIFIKSEGLQLVYNTPEIEYYKKE